MVADDETLRAVARLLAAILAQVQSIDRKLVDLHMKP